jgi:hypothetical protein
MSHPGVGGRGEEQIPCPMCGKPRVRSQMSRHLEDCHTRDGRLEAQRKGYMRGGRGKKRGVAWWKQQRRGGF